MDKQIKIDADVYIWLGPRGISVSYHIPTHSEDGHVLGLEEAYSLLYGQLKKQEGDGG